MRFITQNFLKGSLVAGLLSFGALVAAALPAAARPAIVITDTNIRSAASLQARILDSVPIDTSIEVLNIVLANDGDYWYYVRANFEGAPEGWVRSNLVSFNSSLANYGTLGGDRGDKINVRSGPSLDNKIIHYGLSGDLVMVGESSKEYMQYRWYEITFPNQAKGWVREDLISVWPKGCIITCPAN